MSGIEQRCGVFLFHQLHLTNFIIIILHIPKLLENLIQYSIAKFGNPEIMMMKLIGSTVFNTGVYFAIEAIQVCMLHRLWYNANKGIAILCRNDCLKLNYPLDASFCLDEISLAQEM